ncbi:hypothetical protein ACO2Q0_05300 [Phenylobacterium sp. VNQ135]|uniref:hypothetical protein n=1 Tax=Phenylobacterium sp. VNQ135 TaxID=3400922 RepID=UPI003C0193D1
MGAHQFSPPDDPTDETGGTRPYGDRFPSNADDFAYKVEIWDANGEFAERVVAVSLSSSIGYAAFYAATREFPGRVVTLRHRDRVMSRWTGQAH